MQIFPIGFALILVFLAARLRGPQTGLIAAMALLPFGAMAMAMVGDFNLIAYHGAFILLLGFAVARHLLSPTRHLIPRLELSGVILAALVFYALMTAQLMPRLFAGDVLVFSLNSGVVGQRISPYFMSTVTQLEPSSGNTSQSFYFLLTALVFLLALRMAREKGASVLDKSIFSAAAVNGTMGLLDFIGADAFLALFKTAGYAIFADIKIAGLSRIVGAYPEASSMGGMSAILFAYMLMRYLDTGKKLALSLAGLNLMWAIFALSSTGLVALAIAGTYIFWRSGTVNLSSYINRTTGMRLLIFGVITGVMAIFLFLLTEVGQKAWEFIDYLIFQKSSSLSALERGAWARRGMEIGFETFGIGAGLGSTRSNGLFAVLLSNIGVIGIILFFVFVLAVLKPPNRSKASPADLAFYNAASAGLVTSLAAQLISGTTADPGILFMILAAIAVASRPAVYFKITRAERQDAVKLH